LASAFADPQVQARGLVQKQAVAPVNNADIAPENIAKGAAKGGAEIRTVASPMRLSAAPVQLRYAPPALGEHTAEVLRELGLDAARIQTLQQQGIV
jgi:formyl-CoA transferase